jgi:hypothetical protein
MNIVDIEQQESYGALVDLETISVFPVITFQKYIDKKMEISQYGNSQQILTEFQRNMSDTESTFYKNMSEKYVLENAESVLKNRLIYFVTLVLDKKNGKYLSSTQNTVIEKMQDLKTYLNCVNSNHRYFVDGLEADIENEVLNELANENACAIDQVKYYT